MGGDPPSPTTNESMDSILQAYVKNLPQLLNTTSAGILPYEQASQNAQAQIAPQQQQLNYDMFNQYNPLYANSSAQTENSLLNGVGGQNVRAVDQLNRQIDPEYYNGRAAAGKSLTDLLSGMDPNKLTGAEQSNVERGLQRQGVQSGQNGLPQSSTGAINAALSYGGALDAKRNTIARAIASASQALPTFKSGADPFAQATGRSGTQAFNGGQQFNTTQNGFGSNTVGLGNNLLGSATAIRTQQNQINADRRDPLDRVTGVLGSLPSIS